MNYIATQVRMPQFLHLKMVVLVFPISGLKTKLRVPEVLKGKPSNKCQLLLLVE